ncbi:MAG: glutathione S-transferase family protein [Pseudomonadales bacterium]|nr:glutathione S-transferase family protein [Pseudomonadales bacterium]
MADIILHHYPESPFSEKIRLLLGYKGVPYRSVIIPMIMPKPDLMPLTGGYRKTPVMQVGADVYCDSAIIARVIDELAPADSIYPANLDATAGALAHWTDTFFFKVAVAVAFQPRAMERNSILADPEKAAAFAADRAELSKGSTELRMSPHIAIPHAVSHFSRLERQLEAGRPFLFGNKPVIADFSTYHCLWFIAANEVLRDMFEPFPAVRDWMDKMAALGLAEAISTTGTEALEIARAATPKSVGIVDASCGDGLEPGSAVEIMPIDYGFNPVKGRLTVATTEELALVREDAQVGEVAVHFPRMGFQVAASS